MLTTAGAARCFTVLLFASIRSFDTSFDMFSSLYYWAVMAAGCRAAVQLAGVNIAGFDFGCDIDGNCAQDQVKPPLSSLGGCDGEGQINHFVNDDGLNIFRLPVGWQYLNNGVIGTLDETQLANYDGLVQACLNTSAQCIVDVSPRRREEGNADRGRFTTVSAARRRRAHGPTVAGSIANGTDARWNGAIIGQGGPSNDDFASLWEQLATKYKSAHNVIFGIMNEPHDSECECGGSNTADQGQSTLERGATPSRPPSRPSATRAHATRPSCSQATPSRTSPTSPADPEKCSRES